MNPSPPTAGSPVTLPRLRYPLAYRLPLSAVQRIMTNTSTATCLVPGLSPSPFSLPRVQAHLRIGNDYLQQFGYWSEPTEVRVEEGAVAPTRVDFEAPALAQVIHEICRGVEQPTAPLFSGTTLVWRNAILTGRVTSEAGKPVDGTSVRVYTTTSEFEDVVASIDALSFTTEWRTLAMAPTNSSGFYGVCWLPVDESLMVVALDEEEEINPNDVGQVLGLADLFPGSVRLVTIPREAPYQQLDIVITSR